MEKFTREQISALAALVEPDHFSTGQSNRELHRHDISPHHGTLPAGIIWPVTTEEVAGILSWCYKNDVPATPWGAGTSTEGNPVPTRGGLVIDMTRMDKILEIRPGDLQADVQSGVLRKELNRKAGRHGLFFPPDPGSAPIATGAGYTIEELMRAGERIINAERLFLVRAGFARKDDSLPRRLTNEPMPSGPAQGMVCHLEEMLDEYYQEQEWTPEGIPTENRLASLGLT